MASRAASQRRRTASDCLLGIAFLLSSALQTGAGRERNRGWSGAEAAAAVDHDALAGDEAGVVGGEKAHRVGDVAGGSHPPGGHRGEIGLPDLVGDVRVAFHRDETRGDRVHRDAERGELTSPAQGQADLRVLGRRVGGPARRRPVGDLGVDVDDAAVPPGLHPGQHRPAEQHRALDEEVQLGDVIGPAHLGHRRLGLRAGGVQDQHVNGAERAGDRGDQAVHLVLVGDVGAEALGGAAVALGWSGRRPPPRRRRAGR